jgi:3-phosphoshikimate 1-carboxyvinyltransferase
MKITVRRQSKVTGALQVNGDKSISHRAMMIGAIANGKTRISGFSKGRDCNSTFECLKKLGVAIEMSQDKIIIEGQGMRGLHEPSDILDCGNSGTTMRLLAGLLSGQEFTTVLTGDRSLRKRPMKRVIDPLVLMNGAIWSRSGGLAPLTIQGRTLKAIDYTMPVASAQVKSALVFAGMQAAGVTRITEPALSRDHTERMLVAFKGGIQKDDGRITVNPGVQLIGQDIQVPGDISSAAFLFVLAAVCPGSSLTIKGVSVNPTRTGVIELLRAMGASIVLERCHEENLEPIADVTVSHRSLQKLVVEQEMVPRVIDELPVLAVAATQAQGVSEIRGARELRIKESDRIKAICRGLQNMGARITEFEDGFRVEGPCGLHGACCSSQNDHRIAMALTIAGLIADGETVIHDAECIAISFPEFTTVLQKACGDDAVSISE